jgi:aminopeptidase-like protein
MDFNMDKNIGNTLYSWAEDLFPICRSITGPGVRETLLYIKEILPALKIHSVPTGTKVFDWTVPNEWFVHDAYIKDSHGNKIVDFENNNLHLVSYSKPMDEWMDFSVLDKHLHSLPEQPDAIPYVTSYYNTNWGFCLTQNQRELLKEGLYHVVIDSELKHGVLNYGELIIKGETNEEVLLSTYICHPSMANNELSGPIVTAGIARWIETLKSPRYTYRIIFIPETIGSIVYLNKHAEHMKKHTIAGLVLTCIGDDRDYSFLPSRSGDTLIDKVSSYVLNHYVKSYTQYSYLERGSDERQYCSPGIDLPVCSVMRSMYGTYPEYHTSLDNLTLISSDGLKGGFNVIKKIIEILEFNQVYKSTNSCEPQLGKYDLYPTISVKNSKKQELSDIILNVLAYADGHSDLLTISKIIEQDFFVVHEVMATLIDKKLVSLE